MMWSQKLSLALGGLACMVVASSTCYAETRQKPGLWEITTQTDQGSMPKLSPEQQAQMAKMGIKMPASGGITMQVCVTQEQIDRKEPPQPPKNAREKCEQSDVKQSGNTTTWKMVCTGDHPMTGNGSMTLNSPESYAMTMHMTGQDPRLGNMSMNSSMQGKWLAASCPAGTLGKK